MANGTEFTTAPHWLRAPAARQSNGAPRKKPGLATTMLSKKTFTPWRGGM